MFKRLLSIILLCSVISKGHSQVHTYQFNGGFNGTGPTLIEVQDVANCGGTAGSFATQSVATSGCTNASQQIFAFNANDGFSYTNAVGSGGLGITGTYTIHILFKQDNYSGGAGGYQRTLDFDNGTSDNGVYTYTDAVPTICLCYNNGLPLITTSASLNPSQYSLFSMVRDGVSNLVNVYVNGTNVLSDYDDAAGKFVSNGTNPIIFFRDDALVTACESGSGEVRYLSLSNGASDATQVNAAWLSICSALLPVNLTDFTAQKNTNSIALQWKASNETNAAFYNVERSYDGQNFTAIAKVNAKNTSSSSYTYNDLSGISLTNSYTYYRLKSVDVNGNFKYSSIVKVANGKETKVTVFPNPATNFVTISGLNSKDEIRLLSIDGKILSQQTNTGAQSMIMNVEKYKPGTYIIQVKNDVEVSQQKFVKY